MDMSRACASLLLVACLVACDPGPDSTDGGGGAPSEQEVCETTLLDLPIPFEYTFADDHIAVQTAGGVLPVLIGPWGAHTPPHTGHAEGNIKADWVGLFAKSFDAPEIHRLSYDGGLLEEGSCSPGALCGVREEDVLARLPDYKLPDHAVRIIRVEKYSEFGNDPLSMNAFEVEVELCPYRYTLGHVGSISPELSDAMVAAGYDDPRDHVDVGPNLITGAPVTLAPGTPIGHPQVYSQPVVNNPGYLGGVNAVPDSPAAAIEWTAIHMKDSERGTTESEYSYMSPALRSQLTDILVAQGQVLDSFRYRHSQEWLYKSEHVLEATASGFPRAGSAELTGGIGGWWEQPREGTACAVSEDAACDEVFSIFPIHKEGALYDASLYSEDVSYLVFQHDWANGSPMFGELLEPTTTPAPLEGSLLVMWRELFASRYQRIAYLGDGAGWMMMRFGEIVDEASVSGPQDAPAVSPLVGSEPCGEAGVVCLRQQSWGRFGLAGGE